MKFDVIIGNPPFNAAQENDGKRGGGDTLWDKFVVKSFDILKEGGHLCYVHPCGWRSPKGNYAEAKSTLLSKNIKYLEIHDAKDGLKIFGAGTRYDWYICNNKLNDGNLTEVKGEDGKIYKLDLSSVPFITNGMFNEIMSLVAKEGEDKCEICYSRSAYGSDKKHISKEKTNEFKYPVIHSIKKAGLNLIWSNTDKNGHFGIPKVVFGRGQSGTYIDRDGVFGVSQNGSAILGPQEDLKNINEAMNSPKFIELSKYCCLISTSMFIDRYNKDILSTFRKDWWKEFV